MTIVVKAQWDSSDIARRMRATGKAVDRALPRAINKVANSAKGQAVKEIRAAGYKLKATLLRKEISIQRARPGHPVAYIRAKFKAYRLTYWGAKKTARGVSVAVKGARKVVRGTFLATMKSGAVIVARRVKGAKHKPLGDGKWTPALKITSRFGPSLPAMFSNPKVTDAVVRTIIKRLPIVLRQELNYERIRDR